ncbi:tetratricopeptide repeat protein [Chryseobacterium joostei]|uniref:Tetratricopeptide repeat protein n=1 Tax=Chryseobacterium joostei TaxID=112234 RepID=A0A1N7IEU0_9FLAO|nr:MULTISPECIES: tetratricopeptide repeat protein [Chryseobacterium]AZA98120.1 tetratricopeptide repeat protein [Chryseobacterium joostei]SIS35597.1 Tetratricopeptide repeat-containing protein [Chryseobacterium joostei]HCM33328.1 tetratricopeptide repeat protein [Chryseobacterium sp.]
MIKKRITILTFILLYCLTFSQKKHDKNKLIQELSDNTCKCIDSIGLFDRNKKDILEDIEHCIDKHATALQLGKLIDNIDELSEKAPKVNGKKQVTLNLSTDKNSQQYKDSYNEIERYLMKNCSSLKNAVNTSESKYESLSKNKEAKDFYDKAINSSEKEDWKDAIQNYEQAVKIDPKFIYAWDNLGICYRRIGEYDKAIDAYKKSLEIDPKGKMPMQNIAITYIYKKEYQKAIDAYSDFDKVYPGDPEVYYGIGQVYFANLKNNEKALDYICKAYKIYAEQKSPYRTDAETVLAHIYKNMSEEGKIDKFKEVMKNNSIEFK